MRRTGSRTLAGLFCMGLVVFAASGAAFPPDIRKVAVVEFEGEENSGEYAEADLVGRIVDSGLFTVVERQKMDDIIKEQGMISADFVTGNDVRKIGKILGVDALIFGKVNAFKVEDDRGKRPVEKIRKKWVREKHVSGGEEEYRKKLKKLRYYVDEPYLYRRGTVSVSYKMVEVSNARILLQETFTRSYNSARARPVKPLFGKTEYKPLAPEEVPPREAVLDMLLEKVTSDFMRELESRANSVRGPVRAKGVNTVDEPLRLAASSRENPRGVKISDIALFGGTAGPEYPADRFHPGQKLWITFNVENYKQTEGGEIWIKEDILMEDPKGRLLMVRLGLLDLHKIYPRDLGGEPVPVKNDITIPEDMDRGRCMIKIRVLDNITLDADIEKIKFYVE